ncbi:MAG: hypothetical protein KQJ78_18280 [Deltaproteobacteria bacterium]|nr:hypothetical protein [Deltaproteobacteria bacterium]
MPSNDLAAGLAKLFQGVSPPYRPSGWGRLAWGDDWATVRRNYPDLQETSPARLTSFSPMPQARTWRLDFGFNATHNLTSITLTFGGGRETADYAYISQELSARYGAPVASTATSATWEMTGNQVRLSSAPGQGVVLSERA